MWACGCSSAARNAGAAANAPRNALRESKGCDGISALPVIISPSRRDDHDVLLSILPQEGERRSISASLQLSFPQDLASLGGECPEAAVIGCPDEYEASGGCDRATHVHGAGVADSLRLQFLDHAERNPPRDL